MRKCWKGGRYRTGTRSCVTELMVVYFIRDSGWQSSATFWRVSQVISMHATESPGRVVCEWPHTRSRLEIIGCVSCQLSVTSGLQLDMMGKYISEKSEILKCNTARLFNITTGKFSGQGGPWVCFTNKFSGNADATGLGTTHWELSELNLFYSQLSYFSNALPFPFIYFLIAYSSTFSFNLFSSPSS